MGETCQPNITCFKEKREKIVLWDSEWASMTSKFVVIGGNPRGSGIIHLYDVDDKEFQPVSQIRDNSVFTCGTFGASPYYEGQLATGNLIGQLQIWDFQDVRRSVYTTEAHYGMIHAIDGIGGAGSGPRHIATGGIDGAVKVWDTRIKNYPVMNIGTGQEKSSCWSLAFCNSAECMFMLAAGYDNGDIKIFDMRNKQTKWSTCINNRVCSLEFDTKSETLHKLVATSVESCIYVYDNSIDPNSEAPLIKNTEHNSIIWSIKHVPHNRNVFMTCENSGSVVLWEYRYGISLVTNEPCGRPKGVYGVLKLLQDCKISKDPITSLSWCPENEGLVVCTSLDRTVRVLTVTGLKNI